MTGDEKIYPEEWLNATKLIPSNNQMIIDETDKDILFMQVARKDFDETLDYVKNNHHPFSEITYFVIFKDEKGNKYNAVVDVRNNLPSEYSCIMRFLTGKGMIGYCGFSDTQQVVSPIKMKDVPLIKLMGTFMKRINELVGYYTITRCNNKKSKKIVSGNHSADSISNSKKPRMIRLRDIPGLQLSAYVEGNGSKPSHEFNVRGHIRHLKSGREIFIKPYIKCKGRGNATNQIYEIRKHNNHG